MTVAGASGGKDGRSETKSHVCWRIRRDVRTEETNGLKQGILERSKVHAVEMLD
jgi:hypothetical protein